MSTVTRLDDCLSKRNGHLFIEECDAIELVQEFGSPIFVLSEDQIRRNVRRFQAAFQQGWPDGMVKVLPAAKANWALAVQRLADEGCGCVCHSTGRLSARSTQELIRNSSRSTAFRRMKRTSIAAFKSARVSRSIAWKKWM
jgi:hypothetical protein